MNDRRLYDTGRAHAAAGNVFVPMQNGGELAVRYSFVFLFLAVAGAGAWSADTMRRQGTRRSRMAFDPDRKETETMLRLAASTLSLGLLAACVTTPGSHPGRPMPEVTYLCDDLTAIAVHPGVDAIAVLNSGLELRLPQYPGSRYTNGAHEFRDHGTTGIWVVPQRPPVVCRRK